jgi:hypothetical protein
MGLSQVAIPKGDDYVVIAVAEFVNLPLDQRLSLILEQRVRFYDEKGELMSTTEGLKLLRKMRQPATP